MGAVSSALWHHKHAIEHITSLNPSPEAVTLLAGSWDVLLPNKEVIELSVCDEFVRWKDTNVSFHMSATAAIDVRNGRVKLIFGMYMPFRVDSLGNLGITEWVVLEGKVKDRSLNEMKGHVQSKRNHAPKSIRACKSSDISPRALLSSLFSWKAGSYAPRSPSRRGPKCPKRSTFTSPECEICCEQYTLKRRACAFLCGHTLCVPCAVKTLQNGSRLGRRSPSFKLEGPTGKCPYCRSDVKTADIYVHDPNPIVAMRTDEDST